MCVQGTDDSCNVLPRTEKRISITSQLENKHQLSFRDSLCHLKPESHVPLPSQRLLHATLCELHQATDMHDSGRSQTARRLAVLDFFHSLIIAPTVVTYSPSCLPIVTKKKGRFDLGACDIVPTGRKNAKKSVSRIRHNTMLVQVPEFLPQVTLNQIRWHTLS